MGRHSSIALRCAVYDNERSSGFKPTRQRQRSRSAPDQREQEAPGRNRPSSRKQKRPSPTNESKARWPSPQQANCYQEVQANKQRAPPNTQGKGTEEASTSKGQRKG